MISEPGNNQQAPLDMGERRFESLFDSLPIPLWEEDFSRVKTHLTQLGLVGRDTAFVRDYIVRHPDLVGQCVRLVDIINVNRACLALHEAPDRTSLLKGLEALLTRESQEALQEQIVAIAVGTNQLEKDSMVQTLDGQLRQVHVHWIVVPGFEEDLKRVLISTEDITERKRAENALRANETLLNSVIENAGGTIWAIDTRRRLTMANTAYFASTLAATGKEIRLGDEMPPSFIPPQSAGRIHSQI